MGLSDFTWSDILTGTKMDCPVRKVETVPLGNVMRVLFSAAKHEKPEISNGLVLLVNFVPAPTGAS
jgi:hypothetical protein